MIYLDHAATTPIDPLVLDSMMPYLTTEYANASSIHTPGQRARRAIDTSRASVAEHLGAEPSEIIFTSGGTESNNLFLRGTGEVFKRGHIITTKIEHDSVLQPIEWLATQGFEVTYLEVDESGVINPEDLKKALKPETILVSIMYANNEIGTIQPIQKCAEIIKEFRAARPSKGLLGKKTKANVANQSAPYFHTDACQAAGFLPLEVSDLGVDAMTLSAGKIYGPKGVGALYLRGGAHGKIKIAPQLLGGGQEYRLRSGTENTANIVGFAKAFELARARVDSLTKKLTPLRDQLIAGILKNIPDSRLNGSATDRLPNNVNVSFLGLHGEPILLRLDMEGIAASSGSACSSGSLEASHVITALGLGEEWTRSATRFSLGRDTTQKDIDFVLAKLPIIIAELQESNPFH